MSNLEAQPLAIEDFSFGVTDYYVDGDPRSAKSMENLLLTPNKKLTTRWGSIVINDQLPLGTFRINKLSQIKSNLLVFQDKRAYRNNAGVWSEIVGPTSGTFFPSGDSNSIIVDSEWQDHVLFTSDSFCSPQKAFIDNSGGYRVRNAGLPDLPAGFSVTNPTGSGSSYLYAAVISFTYQVGTVTYLDRGPVFYYLTAVVGGAITGGNTATVTIPGSFVGPENWDTANWKVEIYRTTDAGDVFYKLGQVSFGTTSFIDNFTDLTISANEQLYTTSGSVTNTTPPKAKYVHCVNDLAYWAHIKEGSEVLSTEVRQSKSGDPDSVPPTFSAFTESPITGLSSIYDRPLVFCESYIYRIDNYYSDDGSGGMLLRRIDDRSGCISQQSIVQTHLGVFWAGAQGFYWSDGFRVVGISDHLNETYKNIVDTDFKKKRISGTFDPSNQRVFWTIVSIDNVAEEPNALIVLDLKFPFQPSEIKRGGTFTTWVGGDSFKPTQIMRLGNEIYRGDTRGYILKHSVDYFTDKKIQTGVASSSWGSQVINHLYESCFLDFGSKFYRKWVPRILISADNTTNLSLDIRSSNDNNRVTGTLKPIRYKNSIAWGDVLPVWGDPEALWNVQGLIEEWRRFPARGLRCNYKQIIFENAQVNIISSDLLGVVTINPTANTATLGGSYTWLVDIVDYYISFEHDGYIREFKITARTPTTITYEDTSNSDPIAGNYKWVMRGKPKGEVLLLNGYIIHWAYISKSHTPFSSSSLGGNPA
ncbi:MAG TPA: hypothetical protein VFF49_04810 [Thermodesulfobacteriota bacterium]|nr:hypothetical protein [Thermodesulfobacteriota bacterium]